MYWPDLSTALCPVCSVFPPAKWIQLATVGSEWHLTLPLHWRRGTITQIWPVCSRIRPCSGACWPDCPLCKGCRRCCSISPSPLGCLQKPPPKEKYLPLDFLKEHSNGLNAGICWISRAFSFLGEYTHSPRPPANNPLNAHQQQEGSRDGWYLTAITPRALSNGPFLVVGLYVPSSLGWPGTKKVCGLARLCKDTAGLIVVIFARFEVKQEAFTFSPDISVSQ